MGGESLLKDRAVFLGQPILTSAQGPRSAVLSLTAPGEEGWRERLQLEGGTRALSASATFKIISTSRGILASLCSRK